MKKQFIAAFACILAAACSKAELNEVEPGPSGESMTLTLPQTKVAVSGNSYQFELDDEITAIASNGSRATLKPNAASSGTHTATNYFTGTFDKPVTDGSTISFYYNAKSIADNGTATFEQNGDPWLVSTGNNFTRTEDRRISVTATLAAPENVRAIAVIFTGNEGIESFEFHAKDQNIKLETFDGTSFSGNLTVSQNVLNHQSEGIEFMRSNIVYVPKDMEGGFWIKAVKGQQAMYKSYATKNPIENTTVTISSFVPTKVDIDVQISGFATSYSYAKGIDGVAQSIATANSKSNDWMDEGKATYTISREGIPATLLTFDSFKLTVDGKEYTGDEATKAISVAAGNDHTTWGQKDIVATVVYKDLDGNEYTGTQTIVRHITGLPYSKDTTTELSGTGKKSFKISTYTPTPTQVELSLGSIEIHSTSLITVESLSAKLGSNQETEICKGPESWKGGTNTFNAKSLTGTLNGNENIELIRGVVVSGTYIKIGKISVHYALN